MLYLQIYIRIYSVQRNPVSLTFITDLAASIESHSYVQKKPAEILSDGLWLIRFFYLGNPKVFITQGRDLQLSS